MIALGAAMVLMAVGPPGTDVAAALVLGLRSTLSSLVIVVLMESEQVTVRVRPASSSAANCADPVCEGAAASSSSHTARSIGYSDSPMLAMVVSAALCRRVAVDHVVAEGGEPGGDDPDRHDLAEGAELEREVEALRLAASRRVAVAGEYISISARLPRSTACASTLPSSTRISR